MIRFTGYGVIAEKPRVGQFRAPCRKNCTLDRKMIATFFHGLDELNHHAKFGEDRTTRARCMCENMVFVAVCFSVTFRGRPSARCSFEGCIALPFIARFRRGFQPFFYK